MKIHSEKKLYLEESPTRKKSRKYIYLKKNSLEKKSYQEKT